MYDVRLLKGFPEDKQEYIRSRKWYHQRFDGCPHFLMPIGFGECRKEERKPPGTEAVLRCCIFRGGKTDWYLLEEDNQRTTDVFLERSRNGDISFTEELMDKWKADEQAFYDICRDIDRIDLTELDDGDLIALHAKLMDGYIKRVTSSSIIDGFALHSDRILAEKVHTHLKSIGRDADYEKLFSILTAPVHLSFTNGAELSLLEIAKDVKKEPELLKLFQENDLDGILMRVSDSPWIDKRLSEHQRSYFWIHNNYNDAYVLTEGHFIKELKKLLLEGIDVEHEHGYISEHPAQNKERKDMLMDELGMPDELRALIRYSEDFTHWQDGRKKSTFFATHYLSVLTREVARRTGFEFDELRYLLPNELELVFKKEISREELQQRMDKCAILISGKEIHITTDNELIDDLRGYFDTMYLPKGEIDSIKGLCASHGKTRGRVKIVRTVKNIGKVEKGDILVAVMTRPDYVIAMRKAAAIVTDEGGITCHAAIVSRELRIPCVIATKYASKVLKDGDLVEVDADKGIVRKIQ
jgi:phosphohistidine swiveling domain-containing protein